MLFEEWHALSPWQLQGGVQFGNLCCVILDAWKSLFPTETKERTRGKRSDFRMLEKDFKTKGAVGCHSITRIQNFHLLISQCFWGWIGSKWFGPCWDFYSCFVVKWWLTTFRWNFQTNDILVSLLSTLSSQIISMYLSIHSVFIKFLSCARCYARLKKGWVDPLLDVFFLSQPSCHICGILWHLLI